MEKSQLRRNARCTRDQATSEKKMLAAGESVSAVARAIVVPYMSLWHISKGNTWHNA